VKPYETFCNPLYFFSKKAENFTIILQWQIQTSFWQIVTDLDGGIERAHLQVRVRWATELAVPELSNHLIYKNHERVKP